MSGISGISFGVLRASGAISFGMKPQPNDTNTTFQQKHALKTMWRKGLLPTVKRGLYGDTLTQENISIEHIIPKALGGPKNDFWNIALASKSKNNRRGTRDIRGFLTKEMVDNYCAQFEGVRVGWFRGDWYTQGIKKVLRKLGAYPAD